VDAYSLALVLYEALCGFNPVRGATPAETARRIGRPIRPLARARRDLPRELTRTIDLCLHRSPAARGTLEELDVALEQALGEIPAPAGPGIVPRARRRDRRLLEPTRLQAQPPDRPRVAAPAVAATAIAGGGGEDAPAPQARAALPGVFSKPGVQAESWGLPRVVWLALALALALWQTVSGRPGVGLLVLAALAPIALLPVGRRAQGGSGGWLLCALAPALGAIGLAGAFPAIAGQARRWRMRAAYAAVGYWWLVLAEPLLARRLWLGPPGNTPARSDWEDSLSTAAVHVLGPLLSLGVLVGAALWAGAAALLPLIVRGRNAALDVIGVTVWSAALVAAAPVLDASVQGHAVQADPRGALAGAVLGGALAVAARALRGPV
jgi:hypothetical protein